MVEGYDLQEVSLTRSCNPSMAAQKSLLIPLFSSPVLPVPTNNRLIKPCDEEKQKVSAAKKWSQSTEGSPE